MKWKMWLAIILIAAAVFLVVVFLGNNKPSAAPPLPPPPTSAPIPEGTVLFRMTAATKAPAVPTDTGKPDPMSCRSDADCQPTKQRGGCVNVRFAAFASLADPTNDQTKCKCLKGPTEFGCKAVE